MSNSFFQFKQFTIHQERCAMKVCTDACLFGAWMAAKTTHIGADSSILDIGAGTGLLSLMLAQQNRARIDAVELDEHAAEQAAENFEASPWQERLQVIRGDIRSVHLGKKYALIISNPPFFENDLKSTDSRRNLALHSEALSLEELLAAALAHLTDHGQLAILLPYHRKQAFEELAAAKGCYLNEAISVKQTPAHPCFRAMLLFGRVKTTPQMQTIVIREGDAYTAPFRTLLAPYYLKL
ncbi:MAG: methyltransferase [Bacteroidota bacterium]|nr:methyltransferase [Bacteroidota bacterium]